MTESALFGAGSVAQVADFCAPHARTGEVAAWIQWHENATTCGGSQQTA